jgi:hypothetical protein
MRIQSSVLVSAALLAALTLVALPAPALSVTAVSLSVSPEHSKGPCPAVFKFTGKVVLNGVGAFTYKWERSDGAIDSTAPHTASYNGSMPALVEETWTLGAPGAPFHPFHGWAKLHILTPTNKESNEAKFILDCGEGNGNPTGGPGGPIAKCDGKPDLVPVLHSPMDGWVAVKNNGPGSAGPSQLLLKCALVGYPGPGGGCPNTPSSVPPPFFLPPGWALSNTLGVNVPAIPCGAQVAFPMDFWAKMFWSKGTYNFTATADTTNAVAESNEGNNVATSTLVK